MFRDLKEYQSIQSIYEEKVCISDEEKIITSIFEEQEFTEEELAYVKENLEEVLNQVSIEILEEVRDGKFLSEEVLTEEDEALLTEMLIGEGLGTIVRKGLQKAAPLAKKAVSGIKAGIKKAAPVVKKGLKKAGEVAKSAAGKVKQGVKAVVNNPTVRKVAKAGLAVSGLGAAAVGIKKGIDFLRNRNKKKEETPPTDKGGEKKVEVTGSGKEVPKAKPLSDPKSARGQMQQKNIERFGKDRVQKLRDKNAAFQASKRKDSGYSRADFIKDFPNSNAAKEAKKRKSRPNVMDYESFNPSYDSKTANKLAEVYKKMYNTPSEESGKKNLDEGKGYIAKKVVGTVINKALKNPKNINAVRAAGLTAAGTAAYAPIVGTMVAPKTTQKVMKGAIDKVKSGLKPIKKKDTKMESYLDEKKYGPGPNSNPPSRGPKGGVKPPAGPKGEPRKNTGHPVKIIDGKPVKMPAPGMKEDYTPYDIVLEYLLSSQQAATIEEANHIMIEMDAQTIQDIVEQQLNEQN